jgi:endonuclease-3 related protein
VAGEKAKYEEIRALFEASLPRDPATYNEFHGLIVNVGKNWCRTREPLCHECPLESFLPASALGTPVGALP